MNPVFLMHGEILALSLAFFTGNELTLSLVDEARKTAEAQKVASWDIENLIFCPSDLQDKVISSYMMYLQSVDKCEAKNEGRARIFFTAKYR